MLETTNQTKSHGHVLARQLSSAVSQIPEERRQAILERIQLRVAVNNFTGQSYDKKVLAYATSLLQGTKPRQPLGHRNRNRGGR